jgi:hypothetical protein
MTEFIRRYPEVWREDIGESNADHPKGVAAKRAAGR